MLTPELGWSATQTCGGSRGRAGLGWAGRRQTELRARGWRAALVSFRFLDSLVSFRFLDSLLGTPGLGAAARVLEIQNFPYSIPERISNL